MLPDSNVPTPALPWARDVGNRAVAASAAASITEGNAYAIANSAKAAYELIDGRISNIDTFTTGLFQQDTATTKVSSYSQLSAIPLLYQYTSGDFDVRACVTKRIPFAQYNELTVTADGFFQGYTTNTGATAIPQSPSLLPMIMATIPALPRMNADGSYTPNGLVYASRWTVENFEPSLNYNIPGNIVPTIYGSTYAQAGGGFHPDFSASTQIRISRDGYSGYSMKYTREMLMDYMDAVRDYTTENFPPPAGAKLYAPDVNQVEILLGYYYRVYQGAATNDLYINDNRLAFTGGATFVLEGIRNMGY